MNKKSLNNNFHRGKLNVCVFLILGLLTLSACSSAANTPPEKQEVLQGMRDAGFEFDSTLVQVSGEESKDSATVTGPMIGPKEIPGLGTPAPEKGGNNFTEYQEVQLSMQNNQWIVISATLKDTK